MHVTGISILVNFHPCLSSCCKSRSSSLRWNLRISDIHVIWRHDRVDNVRLSNGRHCLEFHALYLHFHRIVNIKLIHMYIQAYRDYETWSLVSSGRNVVVGILTSTADACTPLCKSNGTLFSDIDINELTSVLHKYKTPVTKCCILTCCWVNLVCIRHLIANIMPEKHAWGPNFLMSDSPYIFQLFESWLNLQLFKVTNL